MPDNYLALTPESLPERLYKIKEIAGKVGTDPKSWDVAEVGDGNLNLVFIVYL